MEVDVFFAAQPEARRLYDRLVAALEALGEYDTKVGKSQVAFRRARNFALAWMPGKYLRGDVAPLVLSILLPYRLESSRWKEVVEPYPGRFTHHLELSRESDIDDEVRTWLRRAWEAADSPPSGTAP
jgi:hypothetical protein